MTIQAGISFGSSDGSEFMADSTARNDESLESFGTPASGSITFSANPANLSTITLNGTVVTFATAPAAGQVLIGATLAATLLNLLAVLEAPGQADPNINSMQYGVDATHLYASAETGGAGGNALTLAASTAPASNGTVSGATLAGGANAKTWQTLVANQYGAASPLPVSGSINL